MEISLKTNYGYALVVKADNVNIEEDIENRTYHKTEDGKTDWNKSPVRDVDTAAIDQIANLLSDMIYYRSAEYTSVDLISSLVDKLPDSERQELVKKLHKDWID